MGNTTGGNIYSTIAGSIITELQFSNAEQRAAQRRIIEAGIATIGRRSVDVDELLELLQQLINSVYSDLEARSISDRDRLKELERIFGPVNKTRPDYNELIQWLQAQAADTD